MCPWKVEVAIPILLMHIMGKIRYMSWLILITCIFGMGKRKYRRSKRLNKNPIVLILLGSINMNLKKYIFSNSVLWKGWETIIITVAISTRSTQIMVLKHNFPQEGVILKKWVMTRLGQEFYNMSLEHLVISESKEAIQG